MKLVPFILWPLLSILAACNSATYITQQDISIRELNYGLSKAAVLSKVKLESSPSGFKQITGHKLEIIKHTDTIELGAKIQFGVEYVIEAPENTIIPIKTIWTYPEGMTNLDGNRIQNTEYTIQKETNTYTYSNYSIDAPNERVPGVWKIELFYHEKKLYEKNFYLVNTNPIP